MEHKNPVLKHFTIFCDIDGTIFHYRKFNTYLTSTPTPVHTVISELQRLKAEGHCIVLTSARPENLRDHTIKELNQAKVPYDQIVLGLARGTRFLVNDMEDPTKPRAVGVNIHRDKGFTPDDLKLFKFPA
jgi:hypothetical protein